MAAPTKDFQQRMAALRRAFLAGLAGRIGEIDNLAAAIAGNPAAADSLEKIAALRALVHKLAGAGGMYGHGAIGDAAAAAEQACDEILDRKSATDAEPVADRWRRVEARLKQLRRAAAAAKAG